MESSIGFPPSRYVAGTEIVGDLTTGSPPGPGRKTCAPRTTSAAVLRFITAAQLAPGNFSNINTTFRRLIIRNTAPACGSSSSIITGAIGNGLESCRLRIRRKRFSLWLGSLALRAFLGMLLLFLRLGMAGNQVSYTGNGKNKHEGNQHQMVGKAAGIEFVNFFHQLYFRVTLMIMYQGWRFVNEGKSGHASVLPDRALQLCLCHRS